MLPSKGRDSAHIYSCKCLVTISKAVFTCGVVMAEVFPEETAKSFYGTLERSVSFSAKSHYIHAKNSVLLGTH